MRHAFPITEKADSFADCHNKTSVVVIVIQPFLT
nr:MAG TPA: hypothetical protein [Caudoviricetes sp.]